MDMRRKSWPKDWPPAPDEWIGLRPHGEIENGAKAQAIADLYREHAPRLRRIIRNRTHRDDVGDVVQETFRKWLDVSRTAVKILKPEAYLTRIAANLVRDDARRNARQSRQVHESFDDRVMAGPDPHAQLEARDALNRLRLEVDRLKPMTRDIFLLHRVDQLDYIDIARRTGLSVKGVERHMSKALNQLRRRVGPL